tara:strand:- start:228 stop:1106 length:879 start_codon:yes stop_codon:yes gene_type:complete
MNNLKIISKLIKGTADYSRYFFSPNLDRESKVNADIKDIGYVILPEFSTNEIGVFYNADKNNHKIIHKGTQLSSKTFASDIQSDFDLVMTGIGAKKQFIKRRDDTIDIILQIKSLNPQTTIDLGGESLGGATSSYAFSYLEDEKGKYLHNNIDSLTTINPAFPPKYLLPQRIDSAFFDLYKHIDKDTKNKIEKKPITHHRIKTDIVSKGLEKGAPFGDVKTYELDDNKGILHSHSINRFLEISSEAEEEGGEKIQEEQKISLTPNINRNYDINIKSLCKEYGEQFNERCKYY